MDRIDVLNQAVMNCLKELYSLTIPKVDWDDFIEQNKTYKEGPPPYRFYYLPYTILNLVVENYIYCYNIGSKFHEDLELLKYYIEKPYVNAFNKNGRYNKSITPLEEKIGVKAYSIVLDYIQKAKDFYDRDPELSQFKTAIYLGSAPNSNKEDVIKCWKEYRNIDIELIEPKEWNEL